MPEYIGKYPYGENGLKPGTLFTFLREGFGFLKGKPWSASFHFDKRALPGGIILGITDPSIILNTEKEAYEAAVKQGFVLTTKEGE